MHPIFSSRFLAELHLFFSSDAVMGYVSFLEGGIFHIEQVLAHLIANVVALLQHIDDMLQLESGRLRQAAAKVYPALHIGIKTLVARMWLAMRLLPCRWRHAHKIEHNQ
jgi:hypothetical protein